jgi:hypothetical protein
MQLDIRTPIGWLFTLIGALLILQGSFGAAPAQAAVSGLNINIVWGGVLAVFGAGMLLLRR